MRFLENYPLTRLNTFGIVARARFLAQPASETELANLLCSVTARNLPLLVLGGGSNIVLAGDFPGLVLHSQVRGVHCYASDGDFYYVEAGGGEPWPAFVAYCLRQNWFGLENLSLIPGTVGAAPIQNIGAYGVELTDVLHSLTAVELSTGRPRNFSHAECRFGYRDSVFKQEAAGRYVISRVRFRLRRRSRVNTAYGDIQRELEARGAGSEPGPRAVSEAIIAIRRRKLPDPTVIGNAGSFFKNPVVTVEQFEGLRRRFPEMVAYPQLNGVKLAAGWLIEQAGWKGKRIGPAGTYERQALVLVNHGGATGAEVLAVADAVKAAVWERFGVRLEVEPVVC